MSANSMSELLLIDGNSLAYRAPLLRRFVEIATSTGDPDVPRSPAGLMLVKILTEHGQRPTVVVWDGGFTGLQGVLTPRLCCSARRPDLLKSSGLAEPLIEAFGYCNPRVEGEADDVIEVDRRDRRARGEVVR